MDSLNGRNQTGGGGRSPVDENLTAELRESLRQIEMVTRNKIEHTKNTINARIDALVRAKEDHTENYNHF